MAGSAERRARGLTSQLLSGPDPQSFLTAEALSSQFDEAVRTSFLPQMRQLQARNSARGIRGPVAGALEGDLTSSFHRNLMAQVGRQAETRASIAGAERAQGISLLGTQMEMDLAREQMRREDSSRRRRGIGSMIGAIGGGVVGSMVPGLGTAVGAQVGAGLGNMF